MKKNKIIQLIIFLAGLAILLFGSMELASARHTELRYPIDNSYRWEIDSNNLINDLNAVYPKTGQAEWMTSLQVTYSSPQGGTLHSSGESKGSLGDSTVYSLSQVQAATHANEFALSSYAGQYYVLVLNNSNQVYDIVYKASGSSGRYSFWPNGNESQAISFERSTPSADHWYADYLSQTMGYVQTNHPKLASGSPPPASTGTSSGTGATTGTTGSSSGATGCSKDTCPDTPSEPSPAPDNPNDKSVSETLKQSNITTAWGLSLDVVNVLAIFILLAIAFANILHLDPEAWNFKRMIPALVIGLIAANLSHLICRAIIDFAGMLMNFFVPKQLAAQMVYNIYIGMFGGWTGAGAAVGAGAGIAGIGLIVLFFTPIANVFSCALIIIAAIILLIPVIITGILWFMLIARTYILWFLVILSPIAFFGMFFDPLKKIIGTWWNWFLAWTFMGPIAYFFIYLADGFARDTSMNNTATGCFDTSNSNQVGGIAKFLMVNVLLLLAIVVPYVIGSKIGMGLWAGIGKFLGVQGAKLGLGAGGRAIEKGGRRLGWEGGVRLGKGIQQIPYLPEAVFGKEGVLANMNKARAKDTQTEIEKGLKQGFPGLMKEQNRVFALENGEKWAQTGSAEDLKNGAIRAIGSNRDDLLGASIRGLGVKAQSDRDQSERLKAAELLRDEFGLSVNEARSFVFGDFEDNDNAVALVKSQYKKYRDKSGKEVLGREGGGGWKRETKALSKKEQDKGRSGAATTLLPTVGEQYKQGLIPEQAVGIYDVENPNRFRHPNPPPGP